MEPKNFPEANKTLIKPEGMTDEECGSLPVFNDGQRSISLWRPSLKERLSILFYGNVWVWVVSGYTQPPISLLGTKQIFKKGIE
jgi:hypothetical protein